MTGRIAGMVASLVLLSPALVGAQVMATATDIPWEEIQAVLDSPEGGTDRQVKVVDIGPSNVAVGILHRDATDGGGGPVRGIVHTRVTEVYYIISGSGTLVTGGQIVNRSEPMEGPIVDNVVGSLLHGRVSRRAGPGRVRRGRGRDSRGPFPRMARGSGSRDLSERSARSRQGPAGRLYKPRDSVAGIEHERLESPFSGSRERIGEKSRKSMMRGAS